MQFARFTDHSKTMKGTKYIYTNYYLIHKWDITVGGITFKKLSDDEYNFFLRNF